MIVNDRLTSYLHSLDSRESEIIEAIGREARADRVPIIRQETGSLLKVLLKMNKPQRILEIGTAVAYSAILMSECLEPRRTVDSEASRRSFSSVTVTLPLSSSIRKIVSYRCSVSIIPSSCNCVVPSQLLLLLCKDSAT